MTDEELFLLAQGVPPFGMGAGYATPAAIPMQYDNTGRNVDPSLLAQQLILGQPAAGMQAIPQASQQFSRPSYQPLMTPETYQNFYANNRPAASIYSPLEVPRFKRYVEPVPVSASFATPVNRVVDSGGGYDGGFGGGGGATFGGSGSLGISHGGSGTVGAPGAGTAEGDAAGNTEGSGGPADGSGTAGGGGGGGKIICTAMNHAYGFGSYRNRIWLAYAAKNLTKAHEVGYHAMFLPLVDLAYRKDFKVLRAVLESIARHRSTDLRAEMRGLKRDSLGRAYRFVLEPLCYAVGKLKGY
jgi:hypothetical protein